MSLSRSRSHRACRTSSKASPDCSTRQERRWTGRRTSSNASSPTSASPQRGVAQHRTKHLLEHEMSYPGFAALAWVPNVAPNGLLLPGTASPPHLRDNMAADDSALDQQAMEDLGNGF